MGHTHDDAPSLSNEEMKSYQLPADEKITYACGKHFLFSKSGTRLRLREDLQGDRATTERKERCHDNTIQHFPWNTYCFRNGEGTCALGQLLITESPFTIIADLSHARQREQKGTVFDWFQTG